MRFFCSRWGRTLVWTAKTTGKSGGNMILAQRVMGPRRGGEVRYGKTTWPFRENCSGHRWTIPGNWQSLYILVSMVYFSKWVEAYALQYQVAEVLARELVSWFGASTLLRPRPELQEWALPENVRSSWNPGPSRCILSLTAWSRGWKGP